MRVLPGEGFIPGVVSQNAQFLSLAEVGENEPGIIFGIKKPTTPLSVGSKSYIAVQFSEVIDNPGLNQAADSPSALLMELTLGPGGNGSFQDLYSSEGEIESGTFTYSIDSTPADGNLTVTIDLPPPEPTEVLTGIISQDGSVFSIPLTLPDEPGLIIGIEKSNGDLDASKAKGSYIMSQFADEIDNPGLNQSADNPASGLIEITLDGNGNGTYKDLYASNQAGLTGGGSLTYTLSVNGELTVNTQGNGSINGIMSKDGNMFLLVETSGDFPAISIGIKKRLTGSQGALLLLLGEN
jgi:hypothetical protein